MLKYKGYVITMDGEYPVVNRTSVAKSGKFEGEELLKPVYFPRDIQGALKILQRVTTLDASRECTTMLEVLETIKTNQKELYDLIKGMK